MFNDTFFKRVQGMQISSAGRNSCGVTVGWVEVREVSDEMSSVARSQRSRSLFKLEMNTCTFLLGHQLENNWNNSLMTDDEKIKPMTPNVLSCPD